MQRRDVHELVITYSYRLPVSGRWLTTSFTDPTIQHAIRWGAGLGLVFEIRHLGI